MCINCFRSSEKACWGVSSCLECGTLFKSHIAKKRKYCSKQCSNVGIIVKPQMFLRVSCKTCKKDILHRRGVRKESGKKRIPKYCSRKCWIEGRFGKRLLCENCGGELKCRDGVTTKKKYCSPQCYGKSKEGISPWWCLKNESVRYNSITGNYDIWVKVPKYGRNKQIWRRKSAVVLENLIGRKLIGNELVRTVFLDGNRLNCSPTNLLLSEHRGLFVCKACGKSKSLNQYAILKHGGTCQTCLRKIHKTGRVKLSIKKVSCIKCLRDVPLTIVSSWFCVNSNTIGWIRCGGTWKGVKPMAKKDVWKELLKQDDELAKSSSATLFNRVTLLAKVYDDPHYITEMKKQSKSYVDELSKRIRDTCCANFTELYQILKMYPQKKQWASGSLYDMRLAMLEKLREKPKKTAVKKTRANKQPTLTEVRELKAKNDRVTNSMESENKRLKAGLKQANQVIKTLESQLEASREAIGTLNETISLFRIQKQESEKAAVPV